MTVLFFGVYSTRPEYPRLRNLMEGLRRVGTEVVECRFALAESFEERLRGASSAAAAARFAFRLALSYVVLAVRFLAIPRADAVVVGHPAQFHVWLARLLTRIRRMPAPVLCDAFFSLHEALVTDRKVLGAGSLASRSLELLEGTTFRSADLCLVDTEAHGRYLAERCRLARPPRSVRVGPTFPPFPEPAPVHAGKDFTVLFVGTYIPLQGADTVIEAARLLRDRQQIRFLLVGRGQLRASIEERARGLSRVQFQDWVAAEALGELLRAADVCLGIFGTGPKAARVIPHKVFDACAAGVPLITADTPAIQEVFRPNADARLVPAGDAAALAEAILELQAAPEHRRVLAANAHRLALDEFSVEAIGRQFLAVADEIAGEKG